MIKSRSAFVFCIAIAASSIYAEQVTTRTTDSQVPTSIDVWMVTERLARLPSNAQTTKLTAAAVDTVIAAAEVRGDVSRLGELLRTSNCGEATKRSFAEWWLKRLQDDPSNVWKSTTPRSLLELARLMQSLAWEEGLRHLGHAAAHRWTSAPHYNLTIAATLDLADLADVTGEGRLAELAQASLKDASAFNDRAAGLRLLPEELERLHTYWLQKVEGAARRIESFVASQYLSEPGIPDALRYQDWPIIIGIVAQSPDESARSATAATLGDVLIRHPDLIRPLTWPQFAHLCQNLRRLTGENGGSLRLAVSQWLEIDSAASNDPMVRLAAVAASGDAAALDEIARAVPNLHARQLTSEEIIALANIASRSGRKDIARIVRVIAGDQFFRKANDIAVADVVAVTRSLRMSTEPLKRDQADRLIANLPKVDRSAAELSEQTYEDLARNIERAGATSALREAAAGNGEPVLILEKLAAWTHRHDETMTVYLAELGAKVDSSTGDRKAIWELSRSYAIGLAHEPAPRRTDGFGQIARAMAAAESDEMRVRCLEELAWAGIACGNVRYVAQVIRSARAQVSSQTSRLEKLDKLIRDNQQRSPELLAATERWGDYFRSRREN